MVNSSSSVQLGIFQLIPQPMVSGYLAQLGWDWILLDSQHGAFNSETLYDCIHTIRSAGGKPFVRVPIGDYAEIQKALDLGALGVVVPMVNSRIQAQRAAESAKYPPLGKRSIGGDLWYHYGKRYASTANTETCLLVQIEHIDAVSAAKDILSVEGVDGCYIGPGDMALSLGLSPWSFENDPLHYKAVQHTLEECRAAGKLACTNCSSPADARKRAIEGYDYITVRSDVDLFMDASEKLLEDLQEQRAKSVSRNSFESAK